MISEAQETREEFKQFIESQDPNEQDPIKALSAVPGYGMTQPKGKWAWENPPQIVDPEQAVNAVITEFTKDGNKQNLLKLLFAGVSVEEIVNITLFNAFTEGKFTPDVAELIKPAVSIALIHMAGEEDIPFRVFADPMKSDEIEDEELFRIMQDRNPEMYTQMRENLNASIRQGENPAPLENQPTPQNFLEMGGTE
tara:strand:- start:176 stop:763 length:588 start_codon:yes stop_codon:yes gene_type:complete